MSDYYLSLIVTGIRHILKPVHLSSLGITLKPGMSVALPTRYIQLDTDNYPNASTFDGYRFYDESSNTCTLTEGFKPSNTFLPFGTGISLCPARVLSFRLCQIIFSKVLLGYDLAPIDSKVPVQVDDLTGESFPNSEIQITIRRREDGKDKKLEQ